MSIIVHTKGGSVIRYKNWPAMRDDMDLLDDEPLKAVHIETDITLKPRNHVVMKKIDQKPAPGRFDPEHPAVKSLAKEYGLTPEEYLADPTAHSKQIENNELDRKVYEYDEARDTSDSIENPDIGQLDTSMDEWRAALKVAEHTPGYTITELSAKLKIAESTLRRKLRNLIANGRCNKGVGRRISDNGRSISVIVYQLKEEGEGKRMPGVGTQHFIVKLDQEEEKRDE